VGDTHRPYPIGLCGDPLDCRRADQRLILFKRMKTKGRSLYGGIQHVHRKSPFSSRRRRLYKARKFGKASAIDQHVAGISTFSHWQISPNAVGSCYFRQGIDWMNVCSSSVGSCGRSDSRSAHRQLSSEPLAFNASIDLLAIIVQHAAYALRPQNKPGRKAGFSQCI
jgi:hypothetical protein